MLAGQGRGVLLGVDGWGLVSTGNRKGVIWKTFAGRGVCMGSMYRCKLGGLEATWGQGMIRAAISVRGQSPGPDWGSDQ